MKSLHYLASIFAIVSQRVAQLNLTSTLRRCVLAMAMLTLVAALALLSLSIFSPSALTALHSGGLSALHLLNQAPFSDPWP